MNSFQYVYTKFNFIETTLHAVHDHIIRAMSQQQVTGVPQDSVLGPLLFIRYTTTLSTIISRSSTATFFFSISIVNNSIIFNSFSTVCCSCSHKNSKMSSQITSLAQNPTTHTIQNSFTNKSLQYNKPSSFSDLLTIQPTRSIPAHLQFSLSNALPNPSRLTISDRSFYYQAPVLWNSLPHHLRSHSLASSSQTRTPLLSLSSSQFHKQLKTHLFLHSYISSLA